MRRAFGLDADQPGKFICYWWFIGWDHLSIGLHVFLGAPNIELHLPFGFVRIGLKAKPIILTMADITIVTESSGQRSHER